MKVKIKKSFDLRKDFTPLRLIYKKLHIRNNYHFQLLLSILNI